MRGSTSAGREPTMGSPRRSRGARRRARNGGEDRRAPDRSSAVDENVREIKRWERAILLARSKAEQVSDWIANRAGSGPVVVLHVVWFAGWALVNAGLIPWIQPFDPFPFPLLTTTVSLEAIFLALFVLASQSRLTRQADKRSHLDLQIDLLAEREMTAVLQLLQDIARHLKVQTSVTPQQLRDLMTKTDIRRLMDRLDELPEPAGPAEGRAANQEMEKAHG